jgi:hypothetical protein
MRTWAVWVKRCISCSFSAQYDSFFLSHLGSAICADCFTLPQYVERSYCEAGRSREPGREADMVVVGMVDGACVTSQCQLRSRKWDRREGIVVCLCPSRQTRRR